jgi:exonuclease III
LELWSKGIAREGALLYDIDATVKEISSDDCGRILSCELKYENKTYIITNVYCPNDSGVRKTFIRDIWREKNPSVKQYTFRRGNSKSRIDLILISEELSCHIIYIKIIHCPFSDHDIKIMI